MVKGWWDGDGVAGVDDGNGECLKMSTLSSSCPNQ